jgi:hypothetical protein
VVGLLDHRIEGREIAAHPVRRGRAGFGAARNQQQQKYADELTHFFILGMSITGQ